MMFLLRGLRTYLLDYIFVILLYIIVGGVVDFMHTFQLVLEIAFDGERPLHLANETKAEITTTATDKASPRHPICWAQTNVGSIISNLLPATCQPINDHNRRAGFLFAFGMTGATIVDLFYGNSYIKLDVSPEVGVWVTALNVVYIATVYFPFFVCVRYANKLVGSTIAVMFCTYHFIFDTAKRINCRREDANTNGMFLTIYLMPTYLCCISYYVMHIVIIIQQICLRLKQKQVKDQHDELLYFSDSVYVKERLKTRRKRHVDVGPYSFVTHVWSTFRSYLYKPVPGFKYSTRVLSTFFLSLAAIYMMTVIELFYVIGIIESVQASLEGGISSILNGTRHEHFLFLWVDLSDQFQEEAGELDINELQSVETDIDERSLCCVRVIEESFYETQKKLQDKMKQLIVGIENIKQDKKKKLSESITFIENELEELNKLEEETNSVLHSSDITVLYKKIPLLEEKIETSLDRKALSDNYPEGQFEVMIDVSTIKTDIDAIQIVEIESSTSTDDIDWTNKEGEEVLGLVEGRMNEKGEFWLVRDFDKYPMLSAKLDEMKFSTEKK
ncbi:uncharacterized protein LOC102806303 [Saccoglossus kowalevskii]